MTKTLSIVALSLSMLSFSIAGCSGAEPDESSGTRAMAKRSASSTSMESSDGVALASCSSPPAAWQPPTLPTGTLDALRDHIAQVRTEMVGSWRGIVTTPWVPPYGVELSFEADGHYSSRCLESSNTTCVAFYYGTDTDSTLKQVRLEDSTVFGKVSGEIDVAFSVDGTDFYLPGWQGRIKDLEVDASGQRMRFDFSTGEGSWISFDLWRCAL